MVRFGRRLFPCKREPGLTLFSIPCILDLLQEGVDKGLSVNTLKVQVATLSLFLDVRLAKEPLIKRFLLARAKHTPRLIKQIPPWDLSLDLNAPHHFGEENF